MEARDDRQLLRFQKRLAGLKLLIIDELGFVPLSKTGAELLFEGGTLEARIEALEARISEGGARYPRRRR